MQLDIFEHSRDVMLRNDVVHALEQRDAAMARASWQALATECPHDPSLPSLLVLTEAIEARSPAAFLDHEGLRHARRAVQDHIQPAALRTLGEKGSAAWLYPLWRDLAQRAGPLAFRSDRGEDHAAPLFIRDGLPCLANAPSLALAPRREQRSYRGQRQERWYIRFGDEHWARFTYAPSEERALRLLGSIARGAQIGALAETPEGGYVQVNGDHVTPLSDSQLRRAVGLAQASAQRQPIRHARPAVVTVKRRWT